MNDFYATYQTFKDYAVPSLNAKAMRCFDRDFWRPARCAPGMSVLEIGCGTGLFLAYLKEKGVTDFLGLDQDPALADYIPGAVADKFHAQDVWAYLNSKAAGRTFDRVVLFDVLEHFPAEKGADLLRLIANILNPGGGVLIKVPNMSSPWGAKHQYGDLTHQAAYTPDSLRQLAVAGGFDCLGCVACPEGSPIRRVLDPAFHGLLSKILMTPPEIWSANFIGYLELKKNMAA